MGAYAHKGLSSSHCLEGDKYDMTDFIRLVGRQASPTIHTEYAHVLVNA